MSDETDKILSERNLKLLNEIYDTYYKKHEPEKTLEELLFDVLTDPGD